MNDAWDDYEPEPEESAEPRSIRRRRPRRPDGSNWYLLTGLIIGLVLGLVYAWVISPVKYVDTNPASLSNNSKDEYRRVVALAYQVDHDIVRARERLNLVDKSNQIQILAAQAQRMVAGKQPVQEARALALLASDLGKPASELVQASPTAMVEAAQVSTPRPSPSTTLAVDQAIATPTLPLATLTPTITLTASPTFTPRPTSTMIPTLSAPFTLKSKRSICDNTAHPGMLEIQVNGKDGKPLPGVHIQVSWKDNVSDFYTGLAPEINPGYADFSMTQGLTYNLKVGDLSESAPDLLEKDNCAWRLEFNQQ